MSHFAQVFCADSSPRYGGLERKRPSGMILRIAGNRESSAMPETLDKTTTTTLLEGLFDPSNAFVWEAFDARYRPIITAYALKLGLRPDEADDIAQDALVAFVREYRAGKYNRSRGRLRGWIIGIVKNHVLDRRRAVFNRRERRGDSVLITLPDDARLSEIWETERRTVLLRRALTVLRETSRITDQTIRAFELFVLHERTADDVAAELGVTARDVYMAKKRVAERLREILAQFEQVYDDG